MAFLEVEAGKSTYKILLLIICVLTRKWDHIKAEILKCNIKEENHKSVHYLRRYGLQSMADPKKIRRFFVFCTIKFSVISTKNMIEAYKLTLILLLMSATHEEVSGEFMKG